MQIKTVHLTEQKIPYRLLALAVLALGASAAPAADLKGPKDLDLALKENAPRIIEHVRQQYGKTANVGVLKFAVKRDGKLSYNTGPFNQSVANRLEVALVLANDADNPVGIIARANETAVESKNQRVTPLTADGRKEFFRIPGYRLAWKSDEEQDGKRLQAGAFVTGEVEFSPNLREMTLTVQAFGPGSKEMEKVCSFTAATDLRTLAETGRSCAVPRGPKPEEVEEAQLRAQLDKAVDNARDNEQNDTADVLKNSPIKLKVYYVSGGSRREMKVAGRKLEREPSESETVLFELVNDSDQRYGVVLKVNGENTLFHETDDATECHKWVLEPRKSVLVRGFQQRDLKPAPDEALGFKVLSPDKSEKEAVYYGHHAGTFALVVFPELQKEIRAAAYDVTAAVIARGSLPANNDRPASLEVLQEQLREKYRCPPSNIRGMIIPGDKVKQEIRYDKSFRSAPTPLFVGTVYYWQPPR